MEEPKNYQSEPVVAADATSPNVQAMEQSAEEIGLVNWVREVLKRKGLAFFKLGQDYGRARFYGPQTPTDILIEAGAQEVNTAILIRAEGHTKEAEARRKITCTAQARGNAELALRESEKVELLKRLKPLWYSIFLLVLFVLCVIGEFPFAFDTFYAMLSPEQSIASSPIRVWVSALLSAIGFLACIASLKEVLAGFWDLHHWVLEKFEHNQGSPTTGSPSQWGNVIAGIRVVMGVVILVLFILLAYSIANFRQTNIDLRSASSESLASPTGKKTDAVYADSAHRNNIKGAFERRSKPLKDFFFYYGLYFPFAAAFLLLNGVLGVREKLRLNRVLDQISEISNLLKELDEKFLKHEILEQEAHAIRDRLLRPTTLDSYRNELFKMYKQGYLEGLYPVQRYPDGPSLMDKVITLRNFTHT